MSQHIDKLKEIGFLPLSKERYLEIMSNEPFEFSKEMAEYHWLIYDGDITLEPEYIKYFSGICVLITGDLIINGILDYQDRSGMFVLGDVCAQNIFLSSSYCYFGGTTTFGEVMLIMGGSGAPVHIENPKGILLYTDSDAALIKPNKEHVQVCVDYSYDESFGDESSILQDEFITVDEDGETCIESTDIYDAVMAGRNVIK